VLPSNRALRGRVISFVHRMVECLGERLLPTLPAALAALLPAAADAGEVGDVAALLQQLAARFRGALLPLLAKARRRRSRGRTRRLQAEGRGRARLHSGRPARAVLWHARPPRLWRACLSQRLGQAIACVASGRCPTITP
jgi:hypothetical protein